VVTMEFVLEMVQAIFVNVPKGLFKI